jgi:drug/metabolite transporter (DMT)-like permease
MNSIQNSKGMFMKNKYLFGHLMTLFTVIIWGTTFISTKVLLEDLEPVEILFYRFLIGYLALLLIYPKFKKIKNLREELMFFAAGLCGVTLYFLFENIALKYTLTSNVGLLVSAAPIFTAILAHLFTKDEKFSLNLTLGFLVAIIGIFLIIFNGNFVLKLNPLGDILAILAAVIWAFYSIILKKLGNIYNYIFITRKIFFYGLLTTLPALYLFKVDFGGEKLLAPGVLANIFFLGLVASALCYVMWNTAVNWIGVVKTSNYIYFIPLVTIITAVIILNEKITALAIGGAVLILLGVYISEHGLKVPSNLPGLGNSLKSKNNAPEQD